MRLLGANPASHLTGLEELPGKVNYLLGRDRKKWRTNLPTYAKVRCPEVYPGIDLIYYGASRCLEFDFVVAPGAEPENIRLAFQGTKKISLDKNGNLVLTFKQAFDFVKQEGSKAYYSIRITPSVPGYFYYNLRIVPKHELLPHPQDFNLVRWI